MRKNLTDICLCALLATILALTVLTQANPGTELPNRDYGFYAYIGKQIVKGQLPYRDIWESKPPAIFYLNAFALRLGRGSRWGIWLVEFGFLFSSILASHYLIRRLWGKGAAFFGVFIWLWGLDITLQGGNFTEEYPLLFHFVSLILFDLLLKNPRQNLKNLLLGLLFSASFLFRPNNAVVEALAILILIATLLWKKDIQSFINTGLWIGFGIAIPLGATALYFAYHGLFKAMLDASFFYNLTYSTSQLTASSPIKIGLEILKFVAWIGFLGYLLLIVNLKKLRTNPRSPLYIFLLLGAPSAVFFSDPAKRNYDHYFMNWLPFIALLAAYAFHTFQGIFLRQKDIKTPSKPQTSTLVFIIIAIGFLIVSNRAETYSEAARRFFTSFEKEARTPISVYVENHTRPGEYVLFWAVEPRENLMSHRDAPHSTLFYPLLVGSEIADGLNADFLEDIQENQPVLIVDLVSIDRHSLDSALRAEQATTGLPWPYPPKNLQEFYKYVEDNYYLEAIITGKTVYRLYGTSSP